MAISHLGIQLRLQAVLTCWFVPGELQIDLAVSAENCFKSVFFSQEQQPWPVLLKEGPGSVLSFRIKEGKCSLQCRMLNSWFLSSSWNWCEHMWDWIWEYNTSVNKQGKKKKSPPKTLSFATILLFLWACSVLHKASNYVWKPHSTQVLTSIVSALMPCRPFLTSQASGTEQTHAHSCVWTL